MAAAASASEALDLIPGWPNACFSLAETAYFLHDWPQVVHWAETGKSRPVPDTLCVMNPQALRYSWIIYYTNALYHQGRVADALEWTRKALELCPDDGWHKLNLQFLSERIVSQKLRTEALASAQAIISIPTALTAATTLPQIVWYGPLLDPSGYAEEGRSFVIGMDSLGIRVRAVPHQWCSRIADLQPSESAVMNRLVQTPASEPAVHVFHLQPPHWRRSERGRIHIGRTMCETDRIPESWAGPCNAMDEVWVPCQHNVDTFAQSGVERRKLVKMPQGIDLERYQRSIAPLALRGARGFNFLSIFEWSRHKGWDVLVRAFAAEFRPHENVTLILKTGAVGNQTVAKVRQVVTAELRVARLSVNLPSNIIILACNLPGRADALALPSRRCLCAPVTGRRLVPSADGSHADGAAVDRHTMERSARIHERR